MKHATYVWFLGAAFVAQAQGKTLDGGSLTRELRRTGKGKSGGTVSGNARKSGKGGSSNSGVSL